jgi:hypothetical protein
MLGDEGFPLGGLAWPPKTLVYACPPNNPDHGFVLQGSDPFYEGHLHDSLLYEARLPQNHAGWGLLLSGKPLALPRTISKDRLHGREVYIDHLQDGLLCGGTPRPGNPSSLDAGVLPASCLMDEKVLVLTDSWPLFLSGELKKRK